MTAKPKLHLHIGRHKCGTSSLQRFLTHNSDALAALGYHYPETLRVPYAHHPVAHFYMAQDATSAEPPTHIAEFWKVLADKACSVVSSEAFQNIDPETLVPALAAFDLSVIIYVREPLDYLFSAYAQRVKAGNTDARLEQYAASFYVPYNDFVMAWQRAFPAARLCVRVFERAKLVRSDVRYDFLNLIGLPEESWHRLDIAQEDGNPSIGGDLLEFVRTLVPHKNTLGEAWWQLYAAVQTLALRHEAFRAKPAMPLEAQQLVRRRHHDQLVDFERNFLREGITLAIRDFPDENYRESITLADFDMILDQIIEIDGQLRRWLIPAAATIRNGLR